MSDQDGKSGSRPGGELVWIIPARYSVVDSCRNTSVSFGELSIAITASSSDASGL